MYLIFAPPKKFGPIPPGDFLIAPDVKFWRNLAFCPKQFWQKLHIDMGCIDITPRFMRRLRKTRELFRICVVATGGIGDSLWCMPFVRELRRLHPKAQIAVATERKNMPAWHNFPHANLIIADDFPTLEGVIAKADDVFNFGGVCTKYKKHMRQDPIDAIFDMAGMERPTDPALMRPHIVLTHEEARGTEDFLKAKGIDVKEDIIISIATEASTANRNWPTEYIVELSKKLIDTKYRVVWLGKTPNLAADCLKPVFNIPGVVNLVNLTPLRQSMAVIALSNVFIGPNSALMVVAASLNIPSIGIFGAFNPKRRTKYYSRFSPLWCKISCSPCDEHWSECPNGHPAPCMKMISPEKVFLEVQTLLKKYPRSVIEKISIE